MMKLGALTTFPFRLAIRHDVVIPQADEASLLLLHHIPLSVERDCALNREMLFFAKYTGILCFWLRLDV